MFMLACGESFCVVPSLFMRELIQRCRRMDNSNIKDTTTVIEVLCRYAMTDEMYLKPGYVKTLHNDMGVRSEL